MSENDNLAIVRHFLSGWEGGTYAQLRGAYDRFLDDKCVYENSGLPACEGKDAVFTLIDGIQAATDIQSITAESGASPPPATSSSRNGSTTTSTHRARRT